MPNVVTRWLQKRREKQAARARSPRAPRPAVPALPPERPRALTPSPSREQLCVSAANAVTNSSFFQKLPFEIRRKILIDAFGGRTVHMDLWHDHPEIPLEEGVYTVPPRKWYSHCGRNHIGQDSWTCTLPLKVNENLPKTWVWSSSICHRRLPTPAHRLMDHSQPADDRCRYGFADHCLMWPGENPTKCQIGVMGWLLSCRQAYTEGIDILYGTNTIHTASRDLMIHYKKILHPQRLSSMRSVELIWEFDPFPMPNQKTAPLSDLDSFYSFLDAVPTAFPNVRSLHISIQKRQGRIVPWIMRDGEPRYSWKHAYETTEERIMKPVEAMVRKLNPETRCTVAMPSSMYRDRRDKAKERGLALEQVTRGGDWERHWKPLGDSDDSIGYWIQLGIRDFSIPYVCTMGEGGYDHGIASEDWVFYE